MALTRRTTNCVSTLKREPEVVQPVRLAKRHAVESGMGLTQEANDLFLGVALLHPSDLRLGLIGL